MTHPRHKTTLTGVAGIVLVGACGVLGACSLGTDSDIPTSARISVTGTGTSPLQLIVSTNFFEQIIGEGTEIEAVLIEADTLSIDIPYEATTMLNELGSVLYRLVQPDSVPSVVTMQVFVNDELEYTQDASISQGGSLEYRHIFRPR